MIIGDPYKLAICVQKIPEWNDAQDSFGNGVLSFIIDGFCYPSVMLNITLNRELPILISKLSNAPEDEELFRLSARECLQRIYEKTYPEDWDDPGDDAFNMAPSEYRDAGFFVFAVKYNSCIRFLFSQLEYIEEESHHDLSSPKIVDYVVDATYLNSILRRLEEMANK